MHAEDWLNFRNWTFEEAIDNPIYLYALFILFILCVLWIFISKLKQELIPVFSDDEGDVKITQNALHELVKNASHEIDGVFAPATTIYRRNSGLHLKIRILIKKNSNIKEIRSALQKTIEQTLIDNLSFNNYSGSDIIIKGFKDEN